MALTDKGLQKEIREAKAAGTLKKISDGGGLHVLVTARGGTLWRLAYRFGGSQKTLALGQYPTVTLEAARKRREDAKLLLAEGKDPGVEKKLAKLAQQVSAANTFEAVAAELMAKLKREGKADRTLNKKQWLIDLASVDIGSRPVKELTAAEILLPLRKVEAKGNYETARRLRATIGQVCRYAIATARAENDPTFGLRGAITLPTVTARAALVEREEYAALVRAVWAYDGRSKLTRWALQLMALLYPRPGELRFAEWTELDLEKATWTIPAARMKMRREHKKPLPAVAVDILREVQRLTGNGSFVFPAFHTVTRPMSENTLNTALRRMGFSKEEATAHGFRSSASSLLNESGLWQKDAIEAELAHADADEIRRAYHRAAYWDERLRMADWWAAEILKMVEG